MPSSARHLARFPQKAGRSATSSTNYQASHSGRNPPDHGEPWPTAQLLRLAEFMALLGVIQRTCSPLRSASLPRPALPPSLHATPTFLLAVDELIFHSSTADGINWNPRIPHKVSVGAIRVGNRGCRHPPICDMEPQRYCSLLLRSAWLECRLSAIFLALLTVIWISTRNREYCSASTSYPDVFMGCRGSSPTMPTTVIDGRQEHFSQTYKIRPDTAPSLDLRCSWLNQVYLNNTSCGRPRVCGGQEGCNRHHLVVGNWVTTTMLCRLVRKQ